MATATTSHDKNGCSTCLRAVATAPTSRASLRGLLALPRGRRLALAKGMRLWRKIINKTHLGLLSKERLRRKQHQSPEIVGERNAAVKFAPQDPVNDQSNGELGMRSREVVVQLSFGCGGRYRGRESRGGRCGGTGRGVQPCGRFRCRCSVSRPWRHAYWSQRRTDVAAKQQF